MPLPPIVRWNNSHDEIGTVSVDITAGASVLPVRYFTDPEVHKIEREKMFDRCWVYAGHETHILDAGDYFMRTIGNK